MFEVEAADPTMAENDPNLDSQVQMAQLERIYNQHFNAFVGQSLAVVLIAIILSVVVEATPLFVWAAALVSVQFVRYLHARRFHELPRPFDAARRLVWSRAHVVGMAFTAALWSSGLYVLWPAESGFHQVALLFVITVTTTGALVGHTTHKWSYIAYIFFGLFPVGIRFIAEGSSDHILLGISCWVAAVFLLRIAARSNKAGISAIIIGIKYREQSAMLAEEKARTETLNQQLLQQTHALQESEARFRGLSDAAIEGIAIHAEGRILDANQAALDMLGYIKAEIVGRHIFDFVSPEFHEFATQQLRKNYARPYEITMLHKDGSRLQVELQAKTITHAEKQVRVVALRDISFRKQLEQQALTLKLEQARIELLQSYFQNASHEFKTPLSIIKTSTYLIGRVDDSERREQYLKKIDHQVKRISTLVDSLAFLMKLDSDFQLERTKIDIQALLRDTVATLEASFASKQQHVDVQLADRLPSVQADFLLIRQTFNEILQNAVRYTQEGGTISIRTRHTEDNIVVEIQDNGIGIPEYALDRIFDRFYRIDSAHSTEGFGIGLAIVRNIVELHQGSISVQSQLNYGTTFTLTLPINGE